MWAGCCSRGSGHAAHRGGRHEHRGGRGRIHFQRDALVPLGAGRYLPPRSPQTVRRTGFQHVVAGQHKVQPIGAGGLALEPVWAQGRGRRRCGRVVLVRPPPHPPGPPVTSRVADAVFVITWVAWCCERLLFGEGLPCQRAAPSRGTRGLGGKTGLVAGSCGWHVAAMRAMSLAIFHSSAAFRAGGGCWRLAGTLDVPR